MEEAERTMQNDPEFQGRRWHLADWQRTPYTFAEWVQYIDQCGWGGAFVYGALALAKHVWEAECMDGQVGRSHTKEDSS